MSGTESRRNCRLSRDPIPEPTAAHFSSPNGARFYSPGRSAAQAWGCSERKNRARALGCIFVRTPIRVKQSFRT